MKKTKLLYFIGIGFLVFLPFMRVSVAATPCWVGINDDDVYDFKYVINPYARDETWNADGMNDLIWGWMEESWMGYINADAWNYLDNTDWHVYATISELGDLIKNATWLDADPHVFEYVPFYVDMSYYSGPWGEGYWWDGWLWTMVNESEYVYMNLGLAQAFDPSEFATNSMAVSTNMNWTTVVQLANLELVYRMAEATVVTDAATSEEIGFKITVPALAWTTNTKALEVEVTYDECGLLFHWEVTYGTDSIIKIDLIEGSECTPCPTGGGDAIPGFELPILISVATVSIISLIIFKKMKNR